MAIVLGASAAGGSAHRVRGSRGALRGARANTSSDSVRTHQTPAEVSMEESFVRRLGEPRDVVSFTLLSGMTWTGHGRSVVMSYASAPTKADFANVVCTVLASANTRF